MRSRSPVRNATDAVASASEKLAYAFEAWSKEGCATDASAWVASCLVCRTAMAATLTTIVISAVVAEANLICPGVVRSRRVRALRLSLIG
jgi:hypothetical protein